MVFPAAVAPAAFSIAVNAEVVAPDLTVMILLEMVALALVAVLLKMPRRVVAWLAPPPSLLLMVLKEMLMPYWTRVRMPAAGLVAAPPP